MLAIIASTSATGDATEQLPTPSGLPIWNVPTGTRTIPAGQLFEGHLPRSSRPFPSQSLLAAGRTATATTVDTTNQRTEDPRIGIMVWQLGVDEAMSASTLNTSATDFSSPRRLAPEVTGGHPLSPLADVGPLA